MMSFMDSLTDLVHPDALAVVPVFVNTGAALLPALVAAVTSFVTILFKPRLLIRTCIEKPYLPAGFAAASLLIAVGIWYLATAEPAPQGGDQPATAATATGKLMQLEDWLRLAHELADSDNAAAPAAPAAIVPIGSGATPSATGAAQAPAAATAAGLGRALFFGGGNSRSGDLGGGAGPDKLTKLWAFPMEGWMFLSTPLVAGGRVYGATCFLDQLDTYGSVVCLDAATGRKIWLTDLKDGSKEFKGFFSSPAITADGKSVIIGQGLHPDYDSELVCLDVATGAVKWLIPCPLHIESSPAIEGDIVVAGAGAIEDAEHNLKASADPAKDKNPGYVFAASISTGKVIWKHVVNDPESSPAVADGVVYIGSGFNGCAVAAMRLKETDEQLKAAGLKREIWKTATPFPATGAITLTGDLVLAGCGNGDYASQDPHPAGAVMALDKKTGQVRWKLDMPDGVLGPIAVSGSTAIIPVRSGEVVAIELPQPGAADAQPRILWRQTPRENGRILAGCAVTAERVYAVTHDGFVIAMDRKTGKVLESVYANGEPGEQGLSIASPVVAGGRLYVGMETGGLRCYGDGGN
jgi:outer membrane protein assembly factor BamB